MKQGILFLIVAMGCSTPEVSNTIFVEISPKVLILENRSVDKNKFAVELKKVVKVKREAGFRTDSITVKIKVDPETSRGEIVDLEADLRRLSLKTVVYSSKDSDREVLLRLE